MNFKIRILSILFFLPLLLNATGGERILNVELLWNDNNAKEILHNFEEGISTANIDAFSNYLSDKTYLSLISGHTGYFSPGQAYYVLKDFFDKYKPLSFNFSSEVTDTSAPFASGVLRYSFRGVRSSAMVFISLKFSGDKLVIAQITIN